MIISRTRTFFVEWLPAIVLSLFIGAPLYYITVDRQWPYTEFGVTVFPPEVYPGEKVTITLTGVVNRHCRGIVRRQLVDSEGKVHALVPVEPVLAGAIGSTYSFPRHIIIPSGMPPGPALYQAFPAYECNPFQWVWPVRIKTTEVGFLVRAKP